MRLAYTLVKLARWRLAQVGDWLLETQLDAHICDFARKTGEDE